MAQKIDKHDLPWVALVIASFVFGIAASWERWGNPLVDCGREMNQPLRLARGEMLYSDVRHIYGPLSPYINATLYRIFGPSLDVLYWDGIITSLIILLLVYWIARQLMGRIASTIAVLEVMWLCSFKQAGNYYLPYSYSAIHACALGLATLALVLKAVNNHKEPLNELTSERVKETASHSFVSANIPYLTVAGFVAGLTILAKTEMGLAALVTGAVAAWLAGHPSLKRSFKFAFSFAVPALVVAVTVYTIIGFKVGWHVLASESFLFFQNLPPELIYFNKRMSGFDLPVQSITQMLGAVVKMAAMAGLISAVTLLITARKYPAQDRNNQAPERTLTDAGQVSPLMLWALLAISVALMFFPAGSSISWQQGPYLAMPVLLAAFLIAGLVRYQRRLTDGSNAQQILLVIIVVTYALANLARVMLRVRSGGAYSSYLLPASVIIFTYAWIRIFPGLFPHSSSRRLARNIIVGVMIFHAFATGILLSARYRIKNVHQITTERGTMIAVPDMGLAMNQAIEFVNRNTAPREPVAVMPEGTSINFLTDRPNPLREEITTPGFLDADGEERAIRRLIESNTRVIFITNRATSEFGPKAFGRDYNQRLMQWIEENFDLATVLGPDADTAREIGDATFFIRAYVKKQELSPLSQSITEIDPR